MKFNRLFTSAITIAAATCVAAQTYTYRVESFEDPAFANSATKVTSPTGEWTTNKNVRSADKAQDGSYSLFFAKKDGITLPKLPDGAGTLIYYANNQNRQTYVETSADGTDWTTVETYKDKEPVWFKHIVAINDPTVRFLRIRTGSNTQFYIDNLLLTRPDGTDGDGNVIVSNLLLPYFTNDFEHSFYPQSKNDATSEKSFTVPEQGEWKYLNAYKNTNESYITDGSARSLRMLKSGSYVISPVLSQGVVKVSFNEGRTGKQLSLYTSTDEGATWSLFKNITTDTDNDIIICDRAVNRVKIANETTKGDTDIDNITITAYPDGTPAVLSTDSVTGITSSAATVFGSVISTGDRKIFEKGVIWTVGNGTPVYGDPKATADGDGQLTAKLTSLPADTEISVRAYALSLAGIGYGNVMTLRTLPPSAPTVISSEPVEDDFSDEKHIFYNVTSTITDLGGLDITGVGMVYSTSPSPILSDSSVKGNLFDGKFTVSLPLDPEKTFHLRAYATNAAGTSYGNEMTVTTGKIIIPDYEHRTYYCDPKGNDTTADGSETAPFYSLQKAVDLVQPGDTIYMNAGTYAYATRINIPTIGAPNSGMIRLEGRGGRAVLDFSGQAIESNNQGVRLTGSYWHFYGIDIINAGDNGLLIERNKPSGGSYADIAARTEEGHDNVIENCSFIRNADTGLQMKNLASFNRVINCDSYYNTDPDHGDADGFAVKISHGTGNYFYGCRAWQNSDDGWDQFIKKEGGFPDDITTTLEYCWAFENGYLENGSASKGNGNGFKMGSDQGRNNVILNRCLAFENLNKGFDQNHNTGNMILNNCSGFANADGDNKSRYAYRLDEPVATGHEIRLTNCTSVCDGDDRKKTSFAISSITGILDHCDFYTVPADYMSIDPDEMKSPRLADGSLPTTTFLRPTEGNVKFIDAGVAVAPYTDESRYAEGIVYNGIAPDLGYYESGQFSSIAPILSARIPSGLHAVVTRTGLLIITLDRSDDDTDHSLTIHDLNGRTIHSSSFSGPTVTVDLSKLGLSRQIILVTADNATVKVLI
ncbi:MAG: DUF1565 domain-containing protein [Bacteroides sp.]|nr:DUF1565 domain-containing protein [Bacteroides sp.]